MEISLTRNSKKENIYIYPRAHTHTHTHTHTHFHTSKEKSSFPGYALLGFCKNQNKIAFSVGRNLSLVFQVKDT